jgi:hypothetical protein
MQESSDRISDASAGNGHARTDAESLSELRRVIVGPEIDAVSHLQSQISDVQSHLDDPEIFARNVRKHPREIANAISPVLGPAIRKSIADALQRMVQSLAQALDNSFSLQGLQWRVEAFRSGKPFAEVVMLHTLLFRVEQVFLIHRESGLLLQHIVAPSTQTQDADMVSGMLTAIQDFVRDSFGATEGESLDNIRMGDHTVWIEQGPYAILAIVIRGNAPGELRETMKDALARIHLSHGEALPHFQGDASAFESTRPDLEECLQSAQSHRREKGAISWQVALIALLLLIGISSWITWSIIEHRRWSRFVDALSAEPGIVVTRHDQHAIVGLRDPLSSDPATIAINNDLDPAKINFHWQPYIALHGPFVLQRATDTLVPPTTVKFTLTNGILYAAGSAHRAWIEESRHLAPFIPGVSHFDAAGVKIDDGAPDMSIVNKLRSRLESRLIHFQPASPILETRELAALDSVAAEIIELRESAADLGAAISVRVHGREVLIRTDNKANEVSHQRAMNVRDALLSRGIPASLLTTFDEVVAPESPQADLTRSRSVCFEVTIITESRKPVPHP